MSSRTTSTTSSSRSSTSKSKPKPKSTSHYAHHHHQNNTLHHLANPYATDLRARTANLGANSGALRAQEAALAKHTAGLAKQRGQWQKLADETTGRLKEFGDVQNWAECMERDFLVLEETLRLVEGRGEAGLASGTQGWK